MPWRRRGRLGEGDEEFYLLLLYSAFRVSHAKREEYSRRRIQGNLFSPKLAGKRIQGEPVGQPFGGKAIRWCSSRGFELVDEFISSYRRDHVPDACDPQRFWCAAVAVVD